MGQGMQTPTIDSLLVTGQHLEIWCCNTDCGHQARWTAAEAVQRLGADCTFAEAQRRLSCARCGARGCEKWIRCRPCVLDFYAEVKAQWAARR